MRPKTSLIALLCVTSWLSVGEITVGQCLPEYTFELLSPVGPPDADFGEFVGISGTTAIVGSKQGAFLFDSTSGQQIGTLDVNSVFQEQVVAIDGTNVVAGDKGSALGAYLFDLNTGQPTFELLPDGPKDGSFGDHVGVSGSTAVIGDEQDDEIGDNAGAAYLFDVATGEQLFKVFADDGAAGDRFGRVGISGTTAIIGARGSDDNGEASGSAYLFDVTTGQQLFKLLPDDGAAGDVFGARVAISGGTAIVAAVRDDDNGEDSGAAYLFDTTTGQQLFKLLPDDGAAGNDFGIRVAIDGSIALVLSTGNNANCAYLFDTTTGQQIGKILAPDGVTFAAGNFMNIGISDQTVIIGDSQMANGGLGAVYLFDVSDCVVMGDDITPVSFTVTRGEYVSGGVAELAESDNVDLSLRRATSDIQSRTEFEVKAFSPNASPSTVEVTLEGAVFARSEVTQTIELYDYVAGNWELLDSRPATRFTDSVATVTAAGDLSRFVEAGNLCMEARVRYQSTNPRQQFSSNTDQFIWTITQ